MRTVDVEPAKQLTLYWQEAPDRWIRVATDDTYTPQQVVALAEALAPAAVPVLPPFDLDLSPAGWTTDTVTASTMAFRTPGADLTVVLRERRPLSGTNRSVGPYRARSPAPPTGSPLDVDVTDWNATLEVSASTFTEDDLLRFAAGVHILNRSDPE